MYYQEIFDTIKLEIVVKRDNNSIFGSFNLELNVLLKILSGIKPVIFFKMFCTEGWMNIFPISLTVDILLAFRGSYKKGAGGWRKENI